MALRAWAGDGPLRPPFNVCLGSTPLDTGGAGHAAPFVFDFDGDGVRDLLVGEFQQGRLRIYRNLGSNAQPRFEEHRWFMDGALAGQIPSGCCIGFTPQVIDFDGDGRFDVISGSYPGELYLFRHLENGTFAGRKRIRGGNGKFLNTGRASTVFAADWDADGDLDLMLGNIDGEVHLVRNEGSRTEPVFAQPVRLELSEQLTGRRGHSAPIVVDWDSDGRHDLLAGTGEGSVIWFRNLGSANLPRLAKGKVLVDKSPCGWEFNTRQPGQWGLRAKVCVVDWNGDGQLDLLLGDRSGTVLSPPLEAAQAQLLKDTVEKRDRLRKEMTEVLTSLRWLRGDDEKTERERAEKRKKAEELKHAVPGKPRFGPNTAPEDRQQWIRVGFPASADAEMI